MNKAEYMHSGETKMFMQYICLFQKGEVRSLVLCNYVQDFGMVTEHLCHKDIEYIVPKVGSCIIVFLMCCY